LEENGFASPTLAEREIPYMCSPASRHGRRERAFGFCATKQRSLKRVPRYQALPEWLVRGTDPVPLSESFKLQAATTRIYAFLMSLIDGRRSIKDIANVLAEQRLASREEAEGMVRQFLIKMHDESRRGIGY